MLRNTCIDKIAQMSTNQTRHSREPSGELYPRIKLRTRRTEQPNECKCETSGHSRQPSGEPDPRYKPNVPLSEWIEMCKPKTSGTQQPQESCHSRQPSGTYYPPEDRQRYPGPGDDEQEEQDDPEVIVHRDGTSHRRIPSGIPYPPSGWAAIDRMEQHAWHARERELEALRTTEYNLREELRVVRTKIAHHVYKTELQTTRDSIAYLSAELEVARKELMGLEAL
jgi:hypothetical protein